MAPASRPARRVGKWAWRHKVLSTILALVVLLTPMWVSLGSALTNPGMGSSISARMAEWLRGHGGGWLVTRTENVWYSHHPPPVGGRPPQGVIPAHLSPTTTPPVSAVAHLTPPDP